MNPDHDPRWAHAFVDGELDLGRRLELEARMQADPACARQIEELRALREVVREGATYHAAPASLRERLARAPAAAAGAPSLPGAVAQRGRPLRAAWRWFDARSPAMAFAGVAALVVALVAIVGVGIVPSHDERLLDDVVAGHVRSTLGQHLVDVASSDHHTVKPWLSSKLDFSPPVEELPLPGSQLLGGRVDYLDGHPVAALVYRQGAHVVNAFVWPASGDDRKVRFSQSRGFQVAHWTSGGMAHWVVSDVNRDEFAAVVAAIRAAQGPPPP